MRKLILLATAALFGLSAGDARALQVVVTYDVDASTLGLTSPVTLPNAADITGTLTVVYSADGGGNIANGPATVSSANIVLNLSGGSLAFLGYGGSIAAVLAAPAYSALTGSSLTNPTVGVFNLTGTVTCSGPPASCDTLGSPPSSPISVLGQPLPILGGTVGTGNPSTFSGLLPFGLVLGTQLAQGTITLSGAELSRSVIPEPGTLLLLGSGVLGLASAGRRRAA